MDDDLEETTGLRFIVLSVDKDLSLSMESCDVPAWVLGGAADWLGLYAEAAMCEEMAEETEDPE